MLVIVNVNLKIVIDLVTPLNYI